MRLQSCPHPLIRLAVLLLGLAGGVVLHAASFQAEIEPNTIYLGQSASLSLTFEGGQPDRLPALPRISNLTYGPGGREDRMTIVNGRQSSTTTYRYSVLPSQAGNYDFPPIVVQIGGQFLASEPLRLTVVSPNQAGARANAQPPRAMLRIQVPRTNVFVGEVLPVEILVYAINPSAYDVAPLVAEGFTLGKSERLEQSRVPLNGVIYTRVGVRTSAIPGKTGTLTLGPATGRVQVEIPLARRRGNDPFDLFNDPFFSRQTESQVLNVTSEPLTVEARPLPATNAPPAFTGAVGEYTLEVRAAPTNVAVGEPVHLRIQLAGKGALESLSLPPLEDALRGFRVYPAVSRVETTDTLGIEGAKVFEQDVVPENAQVREIPSLAFAFFDPVNTRYVLLTNPPVPLLVRPAALARTLSLPGAAEPPPKEIVHLKPRLGTLAALSPPLVTRPWFLGLQFAPLLGLLLAWLARQHREHLDRHPRLVRRQEVHRFVKSGLHELSRHARDGEAERFFALVVRLLQEALGERLDLPAASITEAVIKERLEPLGVSSELTRELHALFQACNQARYAPAGSVEDLQETARSVGRVLRELQGLKIT